MKAVCTSFQDKPARVNVDNVPALDLHEQESLLGI